MRDLIAKTSHAPGLELEPTEPLWLNRARFSDRVAATLRRGRTLLAGDAAHAWAPVGGHGMNAGLRGAHNLAWKLAAVVRGGAHERLLDTYSEEQRATARAVMHEMRFNALEIPLPALGLRAFAAAAPLVLSSDGLQKRLEFALSDLGMHHRGSGLSSQRVLGRRLTVRVRAGDRLPDVPVATDGGERTFLRRLLSYDRWTIVLKHGRGDDGASRRTRERRAQEAAGSYPTPVRLAVIRPYGSDAERAFGGDRDGLTMLVRPDGYVGLVASTGKADSLEGELRSYLGRWYVASGARRTRLVPV